MKYILLVIVVAVILLAIIIPLENQLSDCQFECNHLQTRLNRCQELSDYAEILEQVLPPLALARLKAGNETLKQKRHWEYERYEMPLLTEKEIGG